MPETSPPPKSHGTPNDPLVRKLEQARKELLETSTRSRLLHTPLGSGRAKIIELRENSPDQVFDHLVREGKAMGFLAVPTAEDVSHQELLFLPQPEIDERDEDVGARKRSEFRLQTALSSPALQARLRSLAYDAETFEAEQGANILYLAVGFLRWFEPREPEKPRFAPLILVPVSLSRPNANERFRIAYSGEEVRTNLSLQQRLQEETVFLPDLPDLDDLIPTAYASEVAKAIKAQPTWAVETMPLVLGFFSFAKLMMYRDLEPDRWPVSQRLEENRTVQGLLGGGFRELSGALLPDEGPVDRLIDISNTTHVVDADSSQMVAIQDVRSGRDMVIQGPPGTGKSQTITNLIASAVQDGKRVLFVAEKSAALNVVRKNLDRIDLGQICLALHSHKAKKKAVLEDLQETYEMAGTQTADSGDLPNQLRRVRDSINAYAETIHSRLEPSGASPFEIFGKLARLSGNGLTSPDFQLPAARNWTRRDIDDRIRLATTVGAHVSAMGTPDHSPWRGTGIANALPQDAERITIKAARTRDALSKVIDQGERLAGQVELSCLTFGELQELARMGRAFNEAPEVDGSAIGHPVWTEGRAGIVELVRQGLGYASIRARWEKAVSPTAWDEDLTGLESQFAAHGRSWLRWLRPAYREAVARFNNLHAGQPPKRLTLRLELLRDLALARRNRHFIRTNDGTGLNAFGTHWKGDSSEWNKLSAVEAWETKATEAGLPSLWRLSLSRTENRAEFARAAASLATDGTTMLSQVDSLFHELALDTADAFGNSTLTDIPLRSIRDRLHEMAGTAEGLQAWCIWRHQSAELREAGLGAVVDQLANGHLRPAIAGDVACYGCFETLARQAYAAHPTLAVFDGRSHESLLEDFRKLDLRRLALARQEVAARHAGGMPKGGREVGEMGILGREWQKQRRHLPLRQLIKQAGRAIQLIKPVWMMSPLSLAQFVEPGALDFDLVIMDEASQIRPVEALGAIARSKQLVVVGDDRQLPPTSFFDRVIADDAQLTESEELQIADIESILGLCAAQGMSPRMLRWHYRSQHESLIAVSNLEFYRGRLFIVPSAESEGLGLQLRKVRGTYDRGRTAKNRIEARAVAQAVIDHAARYGHSDRFPNGMSLGVGTFSVTQRDAILDELEVLWRANPHLAAFFDADAPEPFFVKNLESIQGDERDVVFVSVGYGPDESGYTAMSFGPLSQQGGERRLNVLMTRARRSCNVFSSITAADIDLGRTQSVGVQVLKTFLQYAETGHLDRPSAGSRSIDSDFEADVGIALAGLGYAVESQVGVAGFFVDLAIKDAQQPGRFLIGIECDGATYHSSRSARDRDRLREQVLRDRGWRIHRIWSTDWFRRRQDELCRAVAAIELARAGDNAAVQDEKSGEPRNSEQPTHFDDATLSRSDGQTDEVSTSRSTYVEATFVEQIRTEPHEVPSSQLAEILVRIVSIEGPIHEEEIARRYAAVCGKERTGNRIREAVMEALSRAVRQKRLFSEGPFYSVQPMTECIPRNRSAARSSTVRRPEMLPPIEIRTALSQVVREQVGVEPEGAIVEVARMLGFQRTGPELRKVIEDEIRVLLGDGALALRQERLYTT
jgi:very-short-patch-repair endonuclease